MPNTPAFVREACSVFVRGTNSTDKDCQIAQKLFEAIGTCEEVSPENLLDPITALSGSGPAYVSNTQTSLTRKMNYFNKK